MASPLYGTQAGAGDEARLWDVPQEILNSLLVKPVTGALDMTRAAMQDPRWGYDQAGNIDPQAVAQANSAAGLAMVGSAPASMLETQGPGMVAASGAQRIKPRMVFPEYAKAYPEIGPPNLAKDMGAKPAQVIRPGANQAMLEAQRAADPESKYFLQKQLTPEALELQKASSLVEADMAKNGFTPYFDPKARFDVDPSLYPVEGSTMTAAAPAQQKTFDTHYAVAGSDEARARLNNAYDQGASNLDEAGNWYFMGQLHDAFVKELGPELGTQMFKERFAKPMATTTGGQDPTSNLRMAALGNFLQRRAQDKSLNVAESGMIPSAVDMPYPVGGRYAQGNADAFNAHIGKEIDPGQNPKRFNFQNDFLGHDRATIDEQMTQLMVPGKNQPPWYAPYERVVDEEAGKRGVSPKAFQDVAWAGAKHFKDEKKGGFAGEPMVQIFNRMIERTSRLTGQKPEDVVRGFIRADRPMYEGGPGGAAFAGVQAPQPVPVAPVVDDPLASVPAWQRT